MVLGWSPAERHDHYDTDGRHTGHTIVTREPEFNDRDREALLGLMRFEAETCDCGYHESLIVPENVFVPQTSVCPVCQARDRFIRRQHADDEKHEKKLGAKADPMTARPADGRRTYMRLTSPEEAAALRAQQDERRRKRAHSDSPNDAPTPDPTEEVTPDRHTP